MENPKKTSGTSRPILIAAVLNLLFAAFVAVLAIQDIETANGLMPRWEVFLQAQPNEIGDTLAGIFGSMTLIWIVASVFQQSIELRAQRFEFEEISQSQAEQVKAMQAQAEIYEDERKRRDEMRSFGELIQLVSSLIDDYQIFADALTWKWLNDDGSFMESTALPSILNNTDKNRRDENIDQLKIAVKSLDSLFSTVISKAIRGEMVEKPKYPPLFNEFLNNLKNLSKLEPALSGASRIRVQRMAVKQAIPVFEEARETSIIWLTE